MQKKAEPTGPQTTDAPEVRKLSRLVRAVEVIDEGFSQVTMPGRFEVVGHQPLVIIDGAHNPPGADSCATVFFDDFDPAGRRILVVGCLQGRDPAEMLAALRADEFDVVHTCTAPSQRGLAAAELSAAARSTGCDEVVQFATVEDAIDAALDGAAAEDAIVITGSLYIVGAARPHLRRVLR